MKTYNGLTEKEIWQAQDEDAQTFKGCDVELSIRALLNNDADGSQGGEDFDDIPKDWRRQWK